jgi:hypothetical protein
MNVLKVYVEMHNGWKKNASMSSQWELHGCACFIGENNCTRLVVVCMKSLKIIIIGSFNDLVE